MLQSVKYNGDVIAHNSRVGLDGGTVESLENLNDFSEVTRSINQPLLLDYVPNAAAAYSVRKLRSAYTGSAIRVRRAFDNTEQDIGFDANGNLNTTALTNFVNGESTLPADYGSGAVAAYSLRYVSSTYSGPVVRVRRSSDNTEQNFTPTEINDGTLTSFVGSENLINDSENLSSWFISNVSINNDVVVAPDGTNTGDAYLNPLSSTSYIAKAFFPEITIGQYNFSCYVKKINNSIITISAQYHKSGSNMNNLTLNFDTGAVTGGTAEFISDGWWRVNITTNVTANRNQFRLSSAESFYVWGIQISNSSTVLPYNKTTTGIGGEGYVTTWYDQRGSNNAVQSTAANQPKIVDKGALILDNGKPTIKFDGVNDFFNFSVSQSSNKTVFLVTNIPANTTTRSRIYEELRYGGVTNNAGYILEQSGSQPNYPLNLQIYNDGLTEIKYNNPVLGYSMISFNIGVGSQAIYLNNNLVASGTATMKTDYTIGSISFATSALNGNIQEIIRYDSNQLSNRANIEFGINNFYNIYSVSKDGFVTTWYDQSGSNNNAVQPTASSQPQIVSSGNTIFENGRVAVKFDGVDDILINANNISMISAFTVFTLYNVLSTAYPYLLSQPYNTNAVKMIGYLGASWGNSYRIFAGTNLVNNLSYTQGKQEVLYGLFNGVNSQIKVSNTQPVLGTAGTNNNTNGLVIGGTLTNLTGTALNGDIQEIVIFSSNQTSKRKLLESEINKYYNIYRPTANVSVYNKQPYTTDDMSQFMSNISTNFNYDQSLDVNTFGDLIGSSKWFGGVLASNGKIYGIPFNSTTILEINPLTKITTTFGNLSGTSKWFGGVLAPNGRIYGVPYNSTTVLEIDPIKRTTTTFGNFSGLAKWSGGVLAPNGKIYCIPADSTTVLEIDPITRTTTTFGTLDSTTFKWYGGVLAPNGKIYCIPLNTTSILEIDPVTKTTTTFGSVTPNFNWYGGVLAPNGKIYGVPFNSTSVLEINPSTQSINTFGSFTGTNKWTGGALAPNGNVYCIPRSATTILEINPRTNATATFGNLTGTDKWGGTVLGTNGEIYGIPLNSTTVLEILSPVTGLDNNIPLSRFLNKF